MDDQKRACRVDEVTIFLSVCIMYVYDVQAVGTLVRPVLRRGIGSACRAEPTDVAGGRRHSLLDLVPLRGRRSCARACGRPRGSRQAAGWTTNACIVAGVTPHAALTWLRAWLSAFAASQAPHFRPSNTPCTLVAAHSMESSFSRIADEQLEGIPEPLVPLEIDNDIADELNDLVRGAHEQNALSSRGEPRTLVVIISSKHDGELILRTIAARTDSQPPKYKWLRRKTADLPSSTLLSAILVRNELLYEKLQRILAVPSAWGHVVSLGSNDAGAVLDLLQEVSDCASEAGQTSRACHPTQWLDWEPVEHPDRRRAIYLLVKLSIGSKQLPRLLYVSNVQIIGNRDPWNGGQSFTAHEQCSTPLKRRQAASRTYSRRCTITRPLCSSVCACTTPRSQPHTGIRYV
jgi:hypothetical protein